MFPYSNWNQIIDKFECCEIPEGPMTAVTRPWTILPVTPASTTFLLSNSKPNLLNSKSMVRPLVRSVERSTRGCFSTTVELEKSSGIFCQRWSNQNFSFFDYKKRMWMKRDEKAWGRTMGSSSRFSSLFTHVPSLFSEISSVILPYIHRVLINFLSHQA